MGFLWGVLLVKKAVRTQSGLLSPGSASGCCPLIRMVLLNQQRVALQRYENHSVVAPDLIWSPSIQKERLQLTEDGLQVNLGATKVLFLTSGSIFNSTIRPNRPGENENVPGLW